MTNEPRDPFGYEDEQDEEAAPRRRRPRILRRPDTPPFAPVVFEDDEEQPRRAFRAPGEAEGDEYASDAGLLRVLGVIVVLGLVIIALVLPWSPISVVGGGDDEVLEGVSYTSREDLPALPENLVAISKLYEFAVDEDVPGPLLSVEIELSDGTSDASTLGYYAWEGERWRRLGDAELTRGGEWARGTIPAQDASIAVLRRTGAAFTLGLIVEAGETPDPLALPSADTIAVMGAALTLDGDDASTINAGGASLRPAIELAGEVPVFLGVRGRADERILDAAGEAADAHLDDLIGAARGQGAAGVLVDYAIGAADGDAFVAFLERLHVRLAAEALGLVVVVPAPGLEGEGVEPDAYDWAAIRGIADALWVRAPLDHAAFQESVAGMLDAPPAAGVDASTLSLIVDRRSAMIAGEAPAEPITLLQALTAASNVDYNVDAIGPGSPVPLRAARLLDGPEGLHWDDAARAVSFTFVENSLERTVQLQNAYSLAFQLDAVARAGFGGVAVEAAGEVAVHPDVWGAVEQFVREGSVELLRPYGPYLTPCWEAEEGAIEGQPECWTEETDASAVVWRAPQDEGAYTVRLVVSDGTVFVAQEVNLRVGETPPDATATPEATEVATEEPTEEPTEAPTEAPTEEPTEEPVEEPTEEATEEPTEEPAPAEDPTQAPTEAAPAAPGGGTPPAEGTPPGPAGNG